MAALYVQLDLHTSTIRSQDAKSEHAGNGPVNARVRLVVHHDSAIFLANAIPSGAHVAFFATIVKHFVRVRHSSTRRHIWSFVCTACVFVLATLGITLQFVCDDYIFYGDTPSLDVEEPFMAYTPQYKLSAAVTVLFVFT